jgi:hypothetical protein
MTVFNIHPPVVGKSLASRNGAGQGASPNNDIVLFDMMCCDVPTVE